MRKSERLRYIEMELIRLQYEVEYLKTALSAFLEVKNMRDQRGPDLDSGKWYDRKPKN